MHLTTQRLILKGFAPSDVHELFDSSSKEEIIAHLGIDPNSYDFYREMHDNGMETHRISLYFFLILDKETRRPLGECGFHSWNKAHDRAEIYYNIRNDEDKQKGYMTEALNAAIDHGFNGMGLHRIEAKVADWNTPSVKLLKRYGFTYEGTMREDYIVDGKYEDSDCYSLLRHEYKTR